MLTHNRAMWFDVWINRAVLILIGGTCFLYALYGSDFAENHLTFAFLNFPVFIGEILLILCMALCMILWAVKYVVGNVQLTGWHWAWFIYGVVVVIEALVGYWQWGPLSFRNAAIFYYPFFAFITFNCYRTHLFDQWVVIGLLSLIGIILITHISYGYFIFTLSCLFIVLVLALKRPWVRWAYLFLFVLSSPWVSIFRDSRSSLVSSLLVCVFIFFATVRFILKWDYRRVFFISIFVILALGLGVFLFSDHNGVKSMINPKELIARYKDTKALAKKFEKTNLLKPLSVQLYSDNKMNKLSLTKSINRNIPVVVEESGTVVQKPIALVQQLPDSVKQVASVVKQSPVTTIQQPVISAAYQPVVVAHQSTVVQGPNQVVSTNTLPLSSTPVPQKEKQVDTEIIIQHKELVAQPVQTVPMKYRSLDIAYNNILFRFFIWQDMFQEIWDGKFIFGVGFGKPQRSKTLEALYWAPGEWERDGWIAVHNSYVHIIYRAGIIGCALIVVIFLILGLLIKQSIITRSFEGILLCGVLIYWLMMANFLVILELPYFAIPFWFIFGLTFAYCSHLKKSS